VSAALAVRATSNVHKTERDMERDMKMDSNELHSPP
jgi:hypothetical protein